jgi:hypothetical protein
MKVLIFSAEVWVLQAPLALQILCVRFRNIASAATIEY